MLNFNRKEADAAASRPGMRSPIQGALATAASTPPGRPGGSPTAIGKELPATVTPREPATSSVRDNAAPSNVAPEIPTLSTEPEPGGSKLSVGINIKLKGVEVSDCDVLVIEGHVEATVNSKVMQIAKPGTLIGTAVIDVAEIDGEFSGELTARTRLIVHGTGRVSGTIRYGKLVVAEGGEISGDVKRLDPAQPQANQPAPAAASAHSNASAPQRHMLRPESELRG